eukprot:CAMPEP_0182445876 /NCGR_PEP_ID=MMETSP1172-20130603/3835_1 /TAXON_ID=708627 /ORGANISM="Timspurckia oligopyrenoides, Strain CCMP3278" /LENGTH=777 /DNA_ID=CAMNT_0024641707 /DNA_START=15 /DNA_END=2348 /DNA_ORIENTATION=-
MAWVECGTWRLEHGNGEVNVIAKRNTRRQIFVRKCERVLCCLSSDKNNGNEGKKVKSNDDKNNVLNATGKFENLLTKFKSTLADISETRKKNSALMREQVSDLKLHTDTEPNVVQVNFKKVGSIADILDDIGSQFQKTASSMWSTSDLGSQSTWNEFRSIIMSQLPKAKSDSTDLDTTEYAHILEEQVAKIIGAMKGDSSLKEDGKKNETEESNEYKSMLNQLYGSVMNAIGIQDKEVELIDPTSRGGRKIEAVEFAAWATFAFDAYYDPQGGFKQETIGGTHMTLSSPWLTSVLFDGLLHAQISALDLRSLRVPLNSVKLVIQQGEMILRNVNVDNDRGRSTLPFFLYIERFDEPLIIQLFSEHHSGSMRLIGQSRVPLESILQKSSVSSTTSLDVVEPLRCDLDSNNRFGAYGESIIDKIVDFQFELLTRGKSKKEHPFRGHEISLQTQIYRLKESHEHEQEEVEAEEGEGSKFGPSILDSEALQALETNQWDLLADACGSSGLSIEQSERLVFLDNEETDTQVHIFRIVNQKSIIVAFRGTEQVKWKDFVTDSLTFLQPFEPGLKTVDLNLNLADENRPALISSKICVHYGFLRAYASVRDDLRNMLQTILNSSTESPSEWKILCTGHSLGGALATLLASDAAVWFAEPLGVKIEKVNFGSPKVGNVQFAKWFNDRIPTSYRVVNDADVIARIPRTDYHHAGCTVLLNESGDVWIDDCSGKDPLLSRWVSLSHLIEAEMGMMDAIMKGKGISDHMEDGYFSAVVAMLQNRAKLA